MTTTSSRITSLETAIANSRARAALREAGLLPAWKETTIADTVKPLPENTLAIIIPENGGQSIDLIRADAPLKSIIALMIAGNPYRCEGDPEIVGVKVLSFANGDLRYEWTREEDRWAELLAPVYSKRFDELEKKE